MADWFLPPAVTTRFAQALQVQLVEAEDALELHRLALERAGARVITATSQVRALRVASAADVDVLVCDTSLPGLDGFELLRMLRRVRPELGAIALAARGDEDHISEALRAGFHLHAVKPLAPSDLVHMVGALGKRPALSVARFRMAV